MTDVKKLEVHYHGKLVGYLAETTDHLVAFQYDDNWVEEGFSISPFFIFVYRKCRMASCSCI